MFWNLANELVVISNCINESLWLIMSISTLHHSWIVVPDQFMGPTFLALTITYNLLAKILHKGDRSYFWSLVMKPVWDKTIRWCRGSSARRREASPVAVSAGSDYSGFLLYFKQFHHAPPHTWVCTAALAICTCLASNYRVVRLLLFAFGPHALIKPYIETIE